ncbi:class I SAM-dependent methyltransferase [Methylobacterium iners]|jgi:SAM-dependent methyltransferase|uniref:class I SAM-dependent methyltransferase n=1 Tax=Methylobacterium iners TaxID=418707 RepID=UPI001EE24E05|nr:class I SAM-dependent methyltransferase [Methylobacterium iners]
MASNEAEHWWFSGRRAVVAALVGRLIAPRPGSRILEVGCGSGGNLDLLAGFGRVDAIEQDATARATARARSGLAVRAGALPDDLPVSDGAYDVVALLDVLEHVEEDRASLQALGAKLSASGRLLITVPAMPWLWSAHDEVHHHKRRYTRASLEAVVMAAGLKVERVGYFNGLLFPLAVASRAWKALTGDRSGDDEMPPAPLNGALLRIFASERHFVGRIPLPFGLSVFAIARRPD